MGGVLVTGGCVCVGVLDGGGVVALLLVVSAVLFAGELVTAPLVAGAADCVSLESGAGSSVAVPGVLVAVTDGSGTSTSLITPPVPDPAKAWIVVPR